MTKKVFTCKDTIFYNSQCLFIEYFDVIKCPWYVLLCAMKSDEEYSKVFNTDEIKGLDTESLFEWYLNRKNRNFFYDFERKPATEVPIDIDKFLISQMESSSALYEIDTELNFANVIRLISTRHDLIRKIIIYNEYDSDLIRDDVANMFGPDVTFLSGNFSEILKSIPEDSTYVFSDMNKINILAQEKKINYSSIIMCDGYRYNYITKDKLKADITELQKKFCFKIDFIDNIHTKQD